MRIINRDLTKESVKVFVTNNQIYIEVFFKYHGKWVKETYFQSYDWKIEDDYIRSTIKFIIRTFGLKNPKVTIE